MAARANIGVCHQKLGEWQRAVDVFDAILSGAQADSSLIAPNIRAFVERPPRHHCEETLVKAVRSSDPLAVIAANRRLLYWGLLISLVLHLIFVALYFRPVEQAEEEVVVRLEWQELDTPLLIPPPS